MDRQMRTPVLARPPVVATPGRARSPKAARAMDASATGPCTAIENSESHWGAALLVGRPGMRLRRFSGCPAAELPEPDLSRAILRLTAKSGGRPGARHHRWWQGPVKRPEAGARPWSPHGTALPRKKGPGTLTSLSLPLRVTPLVLERFHAESSRAACGARSAQLHNRPAMGW